MDRIEMTEICDECRNRDVPVYAYPCCNCIEGERYEPREENVR